MIMVLLRGPTKGKFQENLQTKEDWGFGVK